MKDVTAVAKGNRKTVVVGRRRIGLVLDRRFVEGIAANGALQSGLDGSGRVGESRVFVVV